MTEYIDKHFIQIKQSGRSIYLFDKSWARDGGILHGNNFLSEICSRDFCGETKMQGLRLEKNVWVISSIESDPDYLLYLWKVGRGEKIDIYITKPEILFLYSFYKANGFHFMEKHIKMAEKRIIGKNYGCFLC